MVAVRTGDTCSGTKSAAHVVGIVGPGIFVSILGGLAGS